MGTFLLFLIIIIIITEILIFNCSTKQGKDTIYVLSSQNKVVSINKREGVSIESCNFK